MTRDEFWGKVFWDGRCYVWRGRVEHCGHGRLTYQGKPWYAHRLAWTLLKGPIPDGMVLDHVKEKCTNKLCVTPSHLEVVTTAENSRRAGAGQSRPKRPKVKCLGCGEVTTALKARTHYCEEDS